MTTFVLKMIALVLMFIDHIGLYFEMEMPFWLNLILRGLGRSAYPLFLFCMVWGYHYTRNRKKYLLRLYMMSLFMTAFTFFIERCFPVEEWSMGYGYHNIFVPLLLVGLLISAIELFEKDRKKGGLLFLGIAGMQLLYYLLPSLLPVVRSLSGDTLTGILPNLAINEYGPAFIALGVAMYFLKEKQELFCAAYILFSILQFSQEMLDMGAAIQWLMILALPLMLRYNHQKGPGLKYFFYIFYPAHTFLLFYLANFVF